jgi:hypothetical protein
MHFICTPMWTKFYSCKKWMLHLPFSSPLTCRPRPHLCPSGKPAERHRPPRPSHGSPGRRLSPAPWREANPPRPLLLPLLYWPTNAHRHQWRHLDFTVARSPPSHSAPIKGTLATPHLAAPHTTLLSSSLAPELVPTACLQPSPSSLVATHPLMRQ